MVCNGEEIGEIIEGTYKELGSVDGSRLPQDSFTPPFIEYDIECKEG
jgi:hypothetical protein